MSLECANQIFKSRRYMEIKREQDIIMSPTSFLLNLFKLKSAKVHIKIHHSLFIENTSFLNFELMLEKYLYFTLISPFSLINFTLLFPFSTLLLYNTR